VRDEKRFFHIFENFVRKNGKPEQLL